MLVTMSDKELSRINVIQSVVEKRMRRRDAAHQLALTERQTQRLMNRFRESGAAGLANLRRGRPGNHKLPESLKLRVLSLLHDHYIGFGPTLAAEITGSGMCFFQQTIDRRCTDFQKLLAKCRIQTEMSVFLHRRNKLGQ